MSARSSTLDRSNPFAGLRPFEEDDAAFFLGRDAETADLFRRVRGNKTTICFGRSGLGKTSLLLAGLFPRLRDAGFFPIHVRLGFGDNAPGLARQVLLQTAATGKEHGVDVPRPRDDESLWEYFHRAECWSEDWRLLTPVIVFDQFEELFTLMGPLDPRRAEFVRELSDLMENRVPASDAKRFAEMTEPEFSFDEQPYRVVLSLREDFLPDLEMLRTRMPSIGRNRMRLMPMDGNAALRVVTQVEDLAPEAIAIQIVRFVAGEKEGELPALAVEPALLSIFCRELNNDRLERGLDTFTQSLLDERGDQILDDFYDRTLEQYDNQDAVRMLIEERLLTASGRRIPMAMEDAVGATADGIDEACIDRLIDDRLLRRMERDGVALIELTHDLLTATIRASRDRRRNAERRREAEADKAKLRRQRIQTAAWAVCAVAAVVVGALVVVYVDGQRDEADKQRQIASLATEKGEDFASVTEELTTAVRPLLEADRLDAESIAELRDVLTRTDALRKRYSSAVVLVRKDSLAVADESQRVGAALSARKSDNKALQASADRALAQSLTASDELVRIEAAFFAKTSADEQVRRRADAILAAAPASTRSDIRQLGWIAALSSPDRAQRRSAYANLKREPVHPTVIRVVLDLLDSNQFLSVVPGADAGNLGINARYMAMRVLAESNLSAWRNDTIDAGLDLLTSMPDRYCGISAKTGCITRLGANSETTRQRLVVVARLAAINSTDREFRFHIAGEYGQPESDNPVAIEEIVDRLESRQFTPVGRDLALGYLVEQTTRAGWLGSTERNLVAEMTTFLEQNRREMGPNASRKATQLMSTLATY